MHDKESETLEYWWQHNHRWKYKECEDVQWTWKDFPPNKKTQTSYYDQRRTAKHRPQHVNWIPVNNVAIVSFPHQSNHTETYSKHVVQKYHG